MVNKLYELLHILKSTGIGAFFVKRKPRDSRVVEKRLTGEEKSSVCVKMKVTCQSQQTQTEDFIYEKSNHRR